VYTNDAPELTITLPPTVSEYEFEFENWTMPDVPWPMSSWAHVLFAFMTMVYPLPTFTVSFVEGAMAADANP